MAIACDFINRTHANNNAALTSASFTPADGSLLVAICYGEKDGNGAATDFTISGGSLTWTRRAFHSQWSGNDYSRGIAIYTAPVATGASMTVTLGLDVASWHRALMLFEVTGHDAADPVADSDALSTLLTAQDFALSVDNAAGDLAIAAIGVQENPWDDPEFDEPDGSGWTNPSPAYDSGDQYPCALTARLNTGALTGVDWNVTNSRNYTCAAAISIKADAGGSSPIDGTAAFTEPNETLTGAAAVAVAGAAAFTEPNETLTGVGAVAVVGAADFTEPNETVAASVAGTLYGVVDVTEPDDTIEGAGEVDVVAFGVFTEPNETLEGAGEVDVVGAGAFTEPNETLTGAGAVVIIGTAAFTEPNETINSLVDTGVGFARPSSRRISMGIRIGI